MEMADTGDTSEMISDGEMSSQLGGVEGELNITQRLRQSQDLTLSTAASLPAPSPLPAPSLLTANAAPSPLPAPSLLTANAKLAASTAAAAKKLAAKKVQQEREAVSLNALAQIKEKQVESTAVNAEENSIVNALTLEQKASASSISDVWQTFRRYSHDKRDEYAVCLRCKEDGKSNIESEVKYGHCHSTSKLHQHITSKHKEDHKRKLETVVEDLRKAGTTLLAGLNVIPGAATIDKYIEWISLGCHPLDICEDIHFRDMIHFLNPRSPLETLSARTAKEKVLFIDL